MTTRRRAIRLLHARTQFRLALYVLGITVLFGGLFALNSIAAYENFYGAMLSMGVKPFEDEIIAQTVDYLWVSSALLTLQAIVVVGVSVAFVHRLIGPTVALDRHVRALVRGNYSARVELRDGDVVFTELMQHLNELAEQLEKAGTERS